ncbi:hypothetical protein SOVF_027070 [Spinacia oleracea]|nr:hypothetical protein SOVF_027070 [Spinacia oleracea]
MVLTRRKRRKKEEHVNTVHKDAKHTSRIELKKENKQTTNVQTKGFCAACWCWMKKKEKKEKHAKSKTTNSCNALSKKEHKKEPTNQCFSSMEDHWKEKILSEEEGQGRQLQRVAALTVKKSAVG